MSGWDVLAGALAGGASGYINSRLEDYAQEEAQLRKESDLRLKQMLNQENLQQRHKFAIDEADYRNRQELARDETRYNRDLDLAKLRDKAAMERLDWQYKHQRPKVGALMQQFNDLSAIYGEGPAKRLMLQKMSGTGTPMSFDELPPEKRSKIFSDGLKAYETLNMPPMVKGADGKEVPMPAMQWIQQIYVPQLFQQQATITGRAGQSEKELPAVNNSTLVETVKRLSVMSPDEQYVALQKVSQKLGKTNAEKIAIMLSHVNDRNKNKKFVKGNMSEVEPLVDYYEGIKPGMPGRSGLKYYQKGALSGMLGRLFKPVDRPTGMAARGRR